MRGRYSRRWYGFATLIAAWLPLGGALAAASVAAALGSQPMFALIPVGLLIGAVYLLRWILQIVPRAIEVYDDGSVILVSLKRSLRLDASEIYRIEGLSKASFNTQFRIHSGMGVHFFYAAGMPGFAHFVADLKAMNPALEIENLPRRWLR